MKLLEELSILCGKRSNGEKFVVPPDALQHLNKERGEALILSGRLYPYITILADIDKYDGGKYNYLEIEKEIRDVSAFITFKEINEIEKINEVKSKVINEESVSDLQKELEEKFDELFGTMEDDTEENQ